MEAWLSVSQVAFECLCQWVSAGDTGRRAWAHQSHPTWGPVGLLLIVPSSGEITHRDPRFVQKDATWLLYRTRKRIEKGEKHWQSRGRLGSKVCWNRVDFALVLAQLFSSSVPFA